MRRRGLALAFGAGVWLVSFASCSGDDGGSSSGGAGGSSAAASGGTDSETGGNGAGDGGKSSGGTSGSSAAGAGGEGASAARCPALVPCGGEPDGKWTARAACITDLEPMPEPGCEGALAHTATIEGSYTFFGETNKLLTDIVLTQTVVLDVDDHCARAIASGAATAAIACPLLEAQYADSPQYESVSCEMVSSDLCHCELVGPPQGQNVLNTYTVVGTQILDSQGDPVDFCVDDDTLGIYFVDEQAKKGLTLWFEREK